MKLVYNTSEMVDFVTRLLSLNISSKYHTYSIEDELTIEFIGDPKFLRHKILQWLKNRMEAKGVKMATLPSGATRTDDVDKLDYEGFLSPLVLKRYAEYLHKHRKMDDGTMRASDNWQLGIPLSNYMKSLWRHFMDVWTAHRDPEIAIDQEAALCAVIFNASGYLHELLKGRSR